MSPEGALYDLMQQKFGIGDYDDLSGEPYWKARNVEISKLKGQMRRRRLSVEDLTIAVEFAVAQGRAITGVWQLCDLVGVAKKAQRDANRVTAHASLIEEKNAAAAEAFARGDEGWAARIYAADSKSAPIVLEQWRDHLARAR